MHQRSNQQTKESTASQSTSSNKLVPQLQRDLVSVVGAYLQGGSAQPAEWKEDRSPATWKTEDKEAKEKTINEVQFRMREGFLEYVLKDFSGNIIYDIIVLKTLEEYHIPIEKLVPLTQEVLDSYWPNLARILSARDQIRYGMQDVNALSAATNNENSHLKQKLIDHLVWLIEMGKQNDAEEMIKTNPQLLLARSTDGILPYQYTLCSKDTRMRKMIRRYLNKSDAVMQATEFASRRNEKIEALRQYFKEVRRKTIIAYGTFIQNYNTWTSLYAPLLHQYSCDYWCRVIGPLQNEWPEHWRQEICYPNRNFDGKTEFNSEEALPEAKFCNDMDERWLRRRDDSGEIFLRTVRPEDAVNSIEDLVRRDFIQWLAQPTLVKQGNEYFIFAPQVVVLDKTVQWKKMSFPKEIINHLMLEFPPVGGRKNLIVSPVCYGLLYQTLTAAPFHVDLGGYYPAVCTDSVSVVYHDTTQINKGADQTAGFGWSARGAKTGVREVLAGLTKLFQTDDRELKIELDALLNPAATHATSSFFRSNTSSSGSSSSASSSSASNTVRNKK
jgi:hypothetical protein